jgi:peptide/nickel transport system substrate-binding protein
MRRSRLFAGVAAVLALATTAACGGGGKGGASGSGSYAYNAGLTGVVNPSTAKTNTLNYVTSADWDSMDPGNTYDAFSWDFAPLYTRPLLTYNPKPGNAGLQLVPDLATGLGVASDGGKTWTYHIRSGLKYSNGQPITAQDVAYAVYRSNWGHATLSNGPEYFLTQMDPGASVGKTQTYPGPYKGSKTVPPALISTPNTTTIVFHLQHPFADFNYLAAMTQTSPVPASADTGATFVHNMPSPGPYIVKTFTPGKGATLVKNPDWNPSSDPLHLHPQLANTINVKTEVAAQTVDQDLLSNADGADLSGNGVQSATQSKVLTNPQLKKNVDDPVTGFGYFSEISTKVAPFTDINCRKAVEYAADKVELQTQYGGPTGGEIAHTVLPPTVAGYTDYPDLYPTPNNEGDPAKAKQLIAQCKQDLGAKFTTNVNIAYRNDKPKEAAAAQALQKELDAVGFNVQLKGFPFATYSNFAGSPSYVHQHQIGIAMYEWGADFPDGYGYMFSLVDGLSIAPAGNSNIEELNDPTINGMFAKAISDLDTTSRNAEWGQIDKAVMQQAVILPIVYGKALLYRPPNATNVFVQDAYGMYDYAQMGWK